MIDSLIQLPLITVVIPTFNRATLLKSSLESLANQSILQDQYEVVVVDDGSTDGTREVCKGVSSRMHLRYFRIEKSGISAAKNLGISVSTGSILLFFDDDDVADGELLVEHLKTHDRYPSENIATLGYTTWAPGLEVTPLMQYITEIGQSLFAYRGLKDSQVLDFTYFWGGRSSCKRSLLVKHGFFNQQFRSIEDIELGYRLSKKCGLKVVFNRKAVSYMARPIAYVEFCRRCERQGKALFLFCQLHQDATVHEYCRQMLGCDLKNVEGRWETVKRLLEVEVHRVHELESWLTSGTDARNTDKVRGAYKWIIRAFRLKGFIEAMESYGVGERGKRRPTQETVRRSHDEGIATTRVPSDIAQPTLHHSDFSRKPLLSVVIPTFNRARLLQQSLESLVAQSLPQEQYEVIVVDDGSTDQTKEVCEEFLTKLRLKYFRLHHSGISAAKNLGGFISRGSILLFFDDDDIADKDLLIEHLKAHDENPQANMAVLGYTTWAPWLDVTEVMNYITNIGQDLFAYRNLKDGQVLDFTYFWGGRSSCKRSLLVKHGVCNQKLQYTQDIELGYRLSKLGLKVVFNRSAISYMLRPVTYADFCRRCEGKGKAQFLISQLHPEEVIQQYCQVINAEGEWQNMQQTLEAKVRRVHEIESLLTSRVEVQEKDSLLQELRSLYGWTFNAFKVKGIVEAMRSQRLNQQNELSRLAQ